MRLLPSIGRWCLLAMFLASNTIDPLQGATTDSRYIAYIGTYTVRGSRGIYGLGFDAASGRFTLLGLQAETTNPSFVVVHKNRRFLYAVNEISDYKDQQSGAVRAYRINPKTGALKLLNQKSSGGAGPCYISVDASGKYILVANYQGGSVATFPILGDGSLGDRSAFDQHRGSSVNLVRQKAPHAHSIVTSPDNRFAISADLGIDKLIVYHFKADDGSLTPSNPPSATVPPGEGPRHFLFHPNGRFLFVVNELASTVSVFSYERDSAKLKLQQTVSTLPADFSGTNEAADIHIDFRGNFLYASNRGRDSIKVFAVDAAQGTLTSIADVPSGGKTPRNFAIDPTGKYLIVANEDSDNVVTFSIDPTSGKLDPTGNVVTVPSPVCIAFVRHQ
jgi:6-phosphogluconolactonase